MIILQIVKLCYRLLKIRVDKKVGSKVLLVAEYDKPGGTRTYLFYLMGFLHKNKVDITLHLSAGEIDDEVALAAKKYNFKTIEINFDFWCIDFAGF